VAFAGRPPTPSTAPQPLPLPRRSSSGRAQRERLPPATADFYTGRATAPRIPLSLFRERSRRRLPIDTRFFSRQVPHRRTRTDPTAGTATSKRLADPPRHCRIITHAVKNNLSLSTLSPAQTVVAARFQSPRPGCSAPNNYRWRDGPTTCPSCFRHHHEPQQRPLLRSSRSPDRTPCPPMMDRALRANPSDTPCPLCTCRYLRMNRTLSLTTT
jgi:hypothetical protein